MFPINATTIPIINLYVTYMYTVNVNWQTKSGEIHSTELAVTIIKCIYVCMQLQLPQKAVSCTKCLTPSRMCVQGNKVFLGVYHFTLLPGEC